MKLKVLFDSRGNHYLATESGEILGMFGLHDHDPEWIGFTRKNGIDAPSTAKIIIETTKIEYISSTVDGSVVPSNALPEAPRALPAPRSALPSRTYTELSPEQVQDNIERLSPRPFLCDHDPDDYAPIVRDDEDDEDEEEWEEED